MNLLPHLSFQLPIDDDLLFSRDFTVEKFNRDIFIIEMESPNVLLLRPIQNNSRLGKYPGSFRLAELYHDHIESNYTYDLIVLPTSLISKYYGVKPILIFLELSIIKHSVFISIS